MESDPTDAYAAFDFFVTAEHLLDWLHPDSANGKADREKLRNQYEILQTVSHLACGAKHFDGLRNYHRPLTASLFRTGVLAPRASVQHPLILDPLSLQESPSNSPQVRTSSPWTWRKKYTSSGAEAQHEVEADQGTVMCLACASRAPEPLGHRNLVLGSMPQILLPELFPPSRGVWGHDGNVLSHKLRGLAKSVGHLVVCESVKRIG